MRYFITLNDQEYHLDLERAAEREDFFRASSVSQGEQPEDQPLAVEILTANAPGPAVVRVGTRIFRVLLDPIGSVPRPGKDWVARVNGAATRVRFETALERSSARRPAGAHSSTAPVRAPLPGRVLKINVKPGERVALGAPLLTIEAMKMENEIQAPGAGRVSKVSIEVGAAVEADAELLLLEPE